MKTTEEIYAEIEEMRRILGVKERRGKQKTVEEELRDIGVTNSHTLTNYTRYIKKYFENESELNQERFKEYIKNLHDGRYSAGTIGNIVAALMKYAEVKGVPLSKKGLVPHIEHRIPGLLSIEEIGQIRDYAGKIDSRTKALISLLYDCALRISECLNLDCEDVDLEDNTIFVERRKGGLPQTIPFWENTRSDIIAYLEERERRGFNKKDYPALFVGSNSRMSVSEAERLVRIVGSNAIGKHLYPHLLRHAKAVHLRQAGTSIEDLRDFLGHKDVRTTLIYARIVPTELKKLPRTI